MMLRIVSSLRMQATTITLNGLPAARSRSADLFHDDVLAIAKMEIRPEHRGQRVGLLTLLRLMQMFSSGFALTLIKPWPLQYTATEFEEIAKTGKTSQGWTDRKRGKDFHKLRSYYGKLGFKQIGNTDFFGFPSFRPLPSVKAVMRRARRSSAK